MGIAKEKWVLSEIYFFFSELIVDPMKIL